MEKPNGRTVGTVSSELPPAIIELDFDDRASVVLYDSAGTSTSDSTQLDLPPIPKAGVDSDGFECSICYCIVAVRDQKA
jgi:hypothetical protein